MHKMCYVKILFISSIVNVISKGVYRVDGLLHNITRRAVQKDHFFFDLPM